MHLIKFSLVAWLLYTFTSLEYYAVKGSLSDELISFVFKAYQANQFFDRSKPAN